MGWDDGMVPQVIKDEFLLRTHMLRLNLMTCF